MIARLIIALVSSSALGATSAVQDVSVPLHAVSFPLPIHSRKARIFVDCNDASAIVSAEEAFCGPDVACSNKIHAPVLAACVDRLSSRASGTPSRTCKSDFGLGEPALCSAEKLSVVELPVDDIISSEITLPIDGTRHTLTYLAGADVKAMALASCMTIEGPLSMDVLSTCVSHYIQWADEVAAPSFSPGALHRAALRAQYNQLPHVRAHHAAKHPADSGCFPDSMSLGCTMLHHGTDKAWAHGYFRAYGRHLEPYRNAGTVRLLEIGVNDGSSMQVWRDYFPNADALHGIEHVNDNLIREVDGVTIFRGSQADVSFLDKVTRDGGGSYDVIIDDGSHNPQDQLLSFVVLFERALADGGIYVIEDVETSYWAAEGAGLYGNVFEQPLGIDGEKSFIRAMKNAVDSSVMSRYSSKHGGILEQLIASITFEQNLIIVRRVEPSDAPFRNVDREYKFKDFVPV